MKLKLREAGVQLIDCDHRTPPAIAAGYPYVAIPQMQGGHINFSEARKISTENFNDWTKKAKPIRDDIVLSRRCNPGETAWVSGDVEFALGQNLVLLRSDSTKVYPPFLRWLVRGPEWWEQIGKHLNVGAVFDSLKCADVPNFAFNVPPIPEQLRIAHILGTLDDKIELNRRMNETLEAMARAFFKSWFVDFDPARAKAEGLEPFGMDAATAALFPDSFEDSEIGMIPVGWKVFPLTENVEILSGGTPKTSIAEYWDGDIPWFAIVDAPAASDVFVSSTEKKITHAGLENSAARILEVGTTIITARGTVGKLALVGTSMAMNQSCYALKSKTEKSNYFTYYATRTAVTELQNRAHGSVFDTITRDTLSSIRVPNPPATLIAAFDTKVTPLLKLILNNVLESRTLAALRDTLLPHLLNGKD